jgi:hypothetical protein
MAPNVPMRTAPVATSTVPMRECRVNGSLRRTEAQMELNTRPDWEVLVVGM